MGVILAPANKCGSASRLIEAGAREIYLGFHDENWTERFGNADLNRMSGFGKQANTLSFPEICEEIALICNEQNVVTPAKSQVDATTNGALASEKPDTVPIKLFCTFNAATYTSSQIAFIAENYLPVLAQTGLTGIIISDPQLIEVARRYSLDVVASTMCAVYNEDIARFFQDQGVERIILPRDLTLEEIAAVKHAVPRMEYEVFLMRNGCVFSDSHCLGLHRANRPSLCRSLRESPWWEVPIAKENGESMSDEAIAQRLVSGRLHKEIFHESTCGLCALWRLEQIGINAYKIVGRSDDIDDLCRDIALVNENIMLAQNCPDEADYLKNMVIPDDMHTICAHEGLSCYYPEVRFA